VACLPGCSPAGPAVRPRRERAVAKVVQLEVVVPDRMRVKPGMVVALCLDFVQEKTVARGVVQPGSPARESSVSSRVIPDLSVTNLEGEGPALLACSIVAARTLLSRSMKWQLAVHQPSLPYLTLAMGHHSFDMAFHLLLVLLCNKNRTLSLFTSVHTYPYCPTLSLFLCYEQVSVLEHRAKWLSCLSLHTV
jgi:hypothetical protein